ncbi:hypothetical protein BC939DRAFT_465644 [Gamsiella multidivaricata]|uniref:uncharacterized protein n=1 Tax=Gamsiella multidivaricata TaxID=101098 RepID=UPI00221F8DB3|nr:uncharacterized protein BC939DRAFT_465644 [Gamsiella multidivaricata]KAI7817533.1 hypothetical protein BC939DRAFT_465644 [Gamsiella multidivaricata]
MYTVVPFFRPFSFCLYQFLISLPSILTFFHVFNDPFLSPYIPLLINLDHRQL